MYYIYHIKGVKFGCTDNPEYRVKKQGYTEYTIHETHTDIYLASDREQELNREYGYPIDKVKYYQIVGIATDEGRRKGGEIAGKISGQKNIDSGHISNLGKIYGAENGRKKLKEIRTKEHQSKAGKIGGQKNVESGHWKRVCSDGGKALLGYKWITKDGTTTKVHGDNVQHYLDDGWRLGRK
jgi:hypothetical protein